MKAKFLTLVVVFFIATQFAVAQRPNIQYFYPLGKDRVSQFETPKTDTVVYDGVSVRVGGAFAMQFQALDHTNTYTENFQVGDVKDQDLYLVGLKNGFNNSVANFNLDVQLAEGVRIELVTYLSSLHHTEAWVKGGFIQFDKLPFLKSDITDKIMDFTTIKVGHMEINYGDGHFRRTDNGNAITNPFVGNYVMDAFDTQIGGELIFQKNGFLGLVGITEGEIKGGTVGTNFESGAAYYGKVGYDNYLNDDLRVRLTSSFYTTEDQVNGNNLYSGDRAGTRYQNALQPESGQSFRAARYNPGFRNKVTSIMVNPFVKFQGFEFFGMYETSAGYRGDDPADQRRVNQMAGELIYRFLPNESMYVGGRYNQVFGEMEDIDVDANITRYQLAAGWFLTKNILAKIEYVSQVYEGFEAGTVNEGGKFDGITFEAVIAF